MLDAVLECVRGMVYRVASQQGDKKAMPEFCLARTEGVKPEPGSEDMPPYDLKTS